MLDIFWPDNFIGNSLIILIVVLLFFSLVAGGRHILRYQHERINLRKLRDKLQKKPEQDTTAEVTKETLSDEPNQCVQPELMDISELKEGINPKTLILERLESVEKMRTHQVKVNLNTLQQMTLAKEEACFGMAIPHFVTNMTMMLGILGTFVGLAIMVQNISLEMPNSAQLDISSWKQALENISAVLDGMKTAFSTTLWGMSCAVISMVINFWLHRIQTSFLQEMEKFTIEDLLPATVPVVEDETLLERVSLQLEESTGRLNNIAEKNNQTIEELNSVEETFRDIIQEIRHITKNEASRNFEQVIEKLTEANISIITLVEHLPKVVTAIETTNSKINNVANLQGRSLLLKTSPQAVIIFTVGVLIILNLIIYFWSYWSAAT